MSRQRLDVKQAAEALNISSEGVRKRIKRGTLDSEKTQNGKVFV
jgi:DNA-directed RNA polymerase specialized sigma24 family protein